MKIHVLASIGNAQASCHPPSPPGISENQRKSIKTHVLASMSNVQASPHPPKPSNSLKSMKIDGNTCPGINWQRAGLPPPSQAFKSC